MKAKTGKTANGRKTAGKKGKPTIAELRVEYLLDREEIRSMVMKYHCKGPGRAPQGS